jgi:hypothetical protein
MGDEDLLQTGSAGDWAGTCHLGPNAIEMERKHYQGHPSAASIASVPSSQTTRHPPQPPASIDHSPSLRKERVHNDTTKQITVKKAQQLASF